MRPLAKRRRSPSRSPSPRQNATASTSTAQLPATPPPSRPRRENFGIKFRRLSGLKSQNNTRGNRSARTPPSPSSLLATALSSTAVPPPPASTQPPESSSNVVAKLMWDGTTEALKLAKESSDWLPVLKAVLGGAVAVIDLGKQVKGNSEEMKSLVIRIESLQPILKMRMDNYRPGEILSPSHIENFARTFEQEVAELKEMQTHGKIRRIMQSTHDKDRLLGVYRCIKDTLNDLQCAFGLAMEHDIDLIKQIVTTHRLPFSKTAAYDAAVGDTISRQPCTKGTRLDVVNPILGWIRGDDCTPVYWLTGPAGVGKTTIAHTLCRHVVEGTEVDGECKRDGLKLQPLVSFFCSHQLDSGVSETLVPTLCQRLVEHFSSFAKHLVPALLEDSTLAHATLPTQFKRMLVHPWNSSLPERKGLPISIIIVDALDENQGGFEFLNLLLDAVRNHKLDGLRFLLTSRTNPEIAKRCERFPPGAVCRLQDVPEEDVQSDITLYLKASLPKVKDELRCDLATRAGNLFIYAATVVKMVHGRTGSEQEMRISKILRQTPARESQILEGLYASIVHDVISDADHDIQRGRLRVLHTILSTLFSADGKRRQIGVGDGHLITQLSEVHEDVFPAVLYGLHAVMYTAKDGSIFTYHASFPDFILRWPTSFNSSVYLNPLCNEGLHHAHLTRRCYEIMAERLHFNMCNLESSFGLDKDIPDLQSRVEDNIDPVLQYAGLYWMHHLRGSRPDEDTQDCIPLCDIPLAFFNNIFLYWLEVVNLLHGTYLSALSIGGDWIKKHCPEHSNIWSEMKLFCRIYDEMLLRSTPHIYISHLSLWKPESHISRMWRPRFPHLPKVTLDGRGNPTYITGWELGTLDSKGDTNIDILGDDNELVGVPPWRLVTGWVLSEDGSRIMWLPHTSEMISLISMYILEDYTFVPELDQISFDFQYLGQNWTRIYEPPLSQYY